MVDLRSSATTVRATFSCPTWLQNAVTSPPLLHKEYYSYIISSHYWILLSAPLAPILYLDYLARRPNQGHTGGGVWTPSCGACLLFCDREKVSALPTLNEVQ
ncbi:unnamed protein product, partial [Ectocarpus sp. 8 AP-2014]